MARIQPVGEARNAWSNWLSPKDDKRFPDGQIIYEVRATFNNCPISVTRTNKTDTQGILYIGETNIKPKYKSKSRYRLLVRSFANPQRRTKHSAAKKFYKMGVNAPCKLYEVRIINALDI